MAEINPIIDMIDVEPRHLQMVRSILAQYLPHKIVWAYGSRVTWQASERSDLDMVVFGSDTRAIGDAMEAFEQSNIPFIIQLFAWESLPDNFKQNIKQKYYILQDETSWRECKLGEVVEVQNGYAFKANDFQENGNIPIIKIKNVASGKVTFDSIQYYNGNIDKLTSYVIKNKDILISMTGSNINQPASIVGKVSRYDRDAISLLNQRVGKIYSKNIEKLSEYFLYYFLIQDMIPFQLASNAGGSANQANISPTLIKSLELKLPPLAEQRAIAEVLSCLDDKIDLLHRQNKTLEAMAQQLFRHYFIDKAQADWEEGTLGDIAKIAIGRTPPRKEFEWFSKYNGIKWISIKDMNNIGPFIFNTAEYLTHNAVEKFKIPIIPENTVILSFKMTVGRVAITTGNMLSNEAIAHFIIKNTANISTKYLYFYLQQFKYQTLGSTSSIVTAINSSIIRDMPIIMPDKQLLNSFEEQTSSYFNKIKSNQTQIQTLIALRDMLLPKLMSGTVRVEYEGGT